MPIVCVKHNIFHKKSQYMIFHVLLAMMQNVRHILDHCPLYIATNIIKIYYCIIGFTMVNSNLPLTAVFTTFLPPLFARADRGVGKWSAFSPVFRAPSFTPVFLRPR